MKLIEGGHNLDEKQYKLYNEIQYQYALFKHYENEGGKKDFSKFYLVFAYNLIEELGLEEEGEDMLKNVKLPYLANQLVIDMDQAVDCRNKADALDRRMKSKESLPYWQLSEFFIVGYRMFDRFGNYPWIAESTEYSSLLKQLEDKEFKVKFSPKMGLVTGGKE